MEERQKLMKQNHREDRTRWSEFTWQNELWTGGERPLPVLMVESKCTDGESIWRCKGVIEKGNVPDTCTANTVRGSGAGTSM